MKKRIFAVLMTTLMVAGCFVTGAKAAECSTSASQTESIITSEEISAPPELTGRILWEEMTESINEEGYFCKREIAPEDTEIEVGGFRRFPGRWAYFMVVPSNDTGGDRLSVLNMNEEFDLHIKLSDQTEKESTESSDEQAVPDETESLGAEVSVNYGWLNSEKLRLTIRIEYGNGSLITYAEDFAVYNPKKLQPSIAQDDQNQIWTFSNGYFSGFEECDIFDFEKLSCSIDSGGVFEAIIPFRITGTKLPQDVMATPDKPASDSQGGDNNVGFDDELESEPFPGDAIIFDREDDKLKTEGSNSIDETHVNSTTCQSHP